MKKRNGEATLADVVESIQRLDERVSSRIDRVEDLLQRQSRSEERRLARLTRTETARTRR